MREMLNKVAVQGNEERYQAICNILDELNVEYRIQEKSYSYSIPIYEKVSKENLEKGFYQISLFEMMENELNDFNEDSYDEEMQIMICIQELSEELGIDLVTEMNEDDYELLAKAALDWGIILPYFEEFKQKYCLDNSDDEDINISHFSRKLEPKVIGYEEHTNVTKNIIVSLKNLCSNPNAKKIVFTAHYDAVNRSTGANDNGSGVVILLAFIREVINLGETTNWFEIVFEDKEETGGIGAKNYIDEFGKEIGEIINLDTCGVGNDIIVADMSTHPVTGTSILVNPNIIKDNNVIIYPRLPYCDSDVFAQKGYQVMTICTLPTEEVSEKKKILLNSLFGKNGSLIGVAEVYKYMHNGERDSIEWIRYDTMQKILDYISLLI